MNDKSIAILPFLNISADSDNEYFSDGITEEIINALTRISGLKVTARTSSFAFKGKQMDVRHIGNQLGVSTVLEGSVRKAKNRVRISAQLIQTTDGFQIWSGRFDRDLDDIFELQDEISLKIADQIRENFGHLEIRDHLVDVPTDNIAAYNLYLKARFNHLKWDREGIENGMAYYDQCISMDPGFSWPYFGAGYCHSMFGSWTPAKESLELADEYIERGFALDDGSFLGYYSKATLQFWGRWNYREGYRLYKKSMALNPSYTEAEEGLAELLIAIGRYDEAMQHVKHILQLDPLSSNHHFTKANIHFLQEEYDKALTSADRAISIDPGFTHGIIMKQLCLIKLNQKDKLDEFIADTPLAESPASCRLLYELSNQSGGRHLDIEEIEKIVEADSVSLVPWPLFIYAQAGYQERALDTLEDAVMNKRGQYANFLGNHFLQPLRASSRFKQLAENQFAPSNLPDGGSSKTTDSVGVMASNGDGNSSKALMEPDEIVIALNQLDKIMGDDVRYLDTSLSLRSLASAADLHPNKLSWLLNDQLGMSFNDYVNDFRLECFKKQALDPVNNNFTLLGLAFESGFNSKSTFNTFFKKRTGTTPRSWLKQQRQRPAN